MALRILNMHASTKRIGNMYAFIPLICLMSHRFTNAAEDRSLLSINVLPSEALGDSRK